MGRRSRFDTMPRVLLDEVNRLVREGRTIGDIREHLAELGAEVSNGSMGRYVKNARDQMRRYQEAQEVAGQWVAKLGENPKGDVGMLLAEMLKVTAFQTLSSMASEDDEGEAVQAAKPMDIMLLAKAIKDLEATAKQSIERRERIEKAVLQRQAKAAESAAKEAGVDDEAFERIRAKFLGVHYEPAP